MKNLFLLILTSFNLFLNAQVNLDEYTTVFFQEVTYECEDYKMYLTKSFARKDVIKVKIRVFNKTNDILLIKPNEFIFNVNGKNFSGYCKPFYIQPNGEDAKFVDVTNFETNLKCESFELTLNGFYKSSTIGEILTVADLKLPTQKDEELNVGSLKCSLKDIKMGYEKSFAKYECSYSGDKAVVIDPTKCVAILASGEENRCTIKKGITFLNKEESRIITIEFKRQNGAGDLNDGFTVKWKETFRNSELLTLKTIKVPMKIDIQTSEK